ncbi:MAG: excinuclease ABC subunit UvrA [Bacteroidota bacterium]|nr:excinuclease ABC subunit UvrA [Bacteroidota bacterium]
MPKEEFIEVFGAREHNLKNIDVKIPRNKLVVITGISGSGKSSLAFDTIYAEGQRRYMESFSAYARSFIGNMERPDVDKIEGLSPVISIEQKTTSRNPRSTVGTVTEIYDFLRLLFARAGKAYSYLSGALMVKQSEDQVIDQILTQFTNRKIILLAPIVKGRKGHYREEFQRIRKMGYSKARVDGDIIELDARTEVDRYKIHDIEAVVDRIIPSQTERFRLTKSVQTCMQLGKGVLMLMASDNATDEPSKIFHFSKTLMDPTTGLAYDEPAPNLFSFNSPYGWCPVCEGLGKIQNITIETIIPNQDLSISQGAITPIGEWRDVWIFNVLETILKTKKQSISTPVKSLPKEVMDIILYGSEELYKIKSKTNANDTWNYKFEGIINWLKRNQTEGSEKIQEWIHEYAKEETCSECKGMRLNQTALHFKLGEKNISELTSLTVRDLIDWFADVESKLDDNQNKIAVEILKEIRKRATFLKDVGLEYLNLDRPIRTLSGGESQRIRLATQVGTQLVGVLYILDEPSIGLHQRDNEKLIASLKNLRDIGNSVLVVEHDKDMMLAADYIIDIGPGAGRHGGTVIAAGTPVQFLEMNSKTSDFLSGRSSFELNQGKKPKSEKVLKLIGATGNNLKNVNLEIPLGKLVCVTGVSGSGKSTLIHETLYPILNKHFFNAKKEPMPYKAIEGIENIDKVIEIDQSPIGRTPRSNPATYTGVFTDIRNLFAQLPQSKIRGYNAGRFSFNVKGGRCETCEGGGLRMIEMEFLPDVQVVCETCKGKRYNRETLEVTFKGKSISDVLEMTVEQAVGFFENQPKISRYIQTLNSVGLEYITIGQHATTLSGGEAQRVKLATELAKKDTGKTLYILDEPTTGLHFQDIKHLMNMLEKLVAKGNTVLIIEHNMDVIKCADWIIDIGPDSAEKGGRIVCAGTPPEVMKNRESFTAKFLRLEHSGGVLA